MDEAYSFLVNDIGISDSVIVACSGGPDSMALLSLVVSIKRVFDLKVIVAHINHNVRRESESEKNFVYDYCISNDLIFEYMKIDSYSEDNFESEARYKRYKFFDELCLKYNCKYVLTAHHGDDLMETILMRIVRGSSLKGYSGFSRISNRNGYSIIRPLIHMTKEEILEFDKKNGISYVVDKTNFLDIHTRNRYRKYVLPDLKKEDLNVHDKFYKFSCVLNEYDSFINKYIDGIINSLFIDGVLYISKVLKFDKFIVDRILNRVFEYYYGDDLFNINDKHVDLVYNLLNSSKPNCFVYLPCGLRAVRSYDEIKFVFSFDLFEYSFEFDGFINLPDGKNIEMVKKTSNNSNNVIRLNSADVKLPLYVRSRRDGDRMFIKGMAGSRKVKDIFIDCKVPMDERNIWPIVVDSEDNVLWIPGIKKSKYDICLEGKCDIILKYY